MLTCLGVARRSYDNTITVFPPSDLSACIEQDPNRPILQHCVIIEPKVIIIIFFGSLVKGCTHAAAPKQAVISWDKVDVGETLAYRADCSVSTPGIDKIYLQTCIVNGSLIFECVQANEHSLSPVMAGHQNRDLNLLHPMLISNRKGTDKSMRHFATKKNLSNVGGFAVVVGFLNKHQS
jgi:hypothetical protein